MCNRKNSHSHQKCTNRLHNSYTAKIDHIKAIRIKNLENVSHPFRMTAMVDMITMVKVDGCAVARVVATG
jgi:hypothetical protein